MCTMFSWHFPWPLRASVRASGMYCNNYVCVSCPNYSRSPRCMFFVGILPNAICALLVCMPRMDAPSTRLAAVYESPTADPCTLILPPLEAGEGMWEQLSEALHRHGLLHAHIRCNNPSDPLPAALIGAARLRWASPVELYCHHPSAGPVPFISPLNEWYALRECRQLLHPVPDGLTAAAVSSALEVLTWAPADSSPCAERELEAMAEAATGLDCDMAAVQVAQCPWGGRGLASQRAIEQGEVVLSVPSSSLLSAASAKRSELAAVLPLVDEGEWTETVVVMLLLLNERRKGRASRWWRWLRLLPREFHNTSSWSTAQLQALRGPAYWRAVSAQSELLEIFATLRPRLYAAAPTLFPPSAFSREAWVWARAVVETRAISLQSKLGELAAGALVIAPLIDMANTSQAPQLEICVKGASLCLQVQIYPWSISLHLSATP